MKPIVLLFAVMASCHVFANLAVAHDAFKEPYEERYNLKTVSCKTCHPNTKDRSIHNALGLMYEKALKGTDITRKFKEAEAKGDEAVEAYEKIMAEEFKKVMPVVENQKMSIKEFIAAGLLNGTRLAVPKDDKK